MIPFLLAMIVTAAMVGGIALTQQDNPLDKLVGGLLVIAAIVTAAVYWIF